jgi:hypothetical protein
LEANGFYLLYELAMNVLSNDHFSIFLDLSCHIMLHCCPKQQLPIDHVFSPIRYVLPQGYDYIVSNELLIAGMKRFILIGCFLFGNECFLDPPIAKDLDDMREKCRSALPSNERNGNTEQRVRPKSSITRTLSASKSSTCRPKLSKGSKSEKQLDEQQTLPKKKSSINGNKDRAVSTLDDLDEAEEDGIPLVEDEELDDEGMN